MKRIAFGAADKGEMNALFGTNTFLLSLLDNSAARLVK